MALVIVTLIVLPLMQSGDLRNQIFRFSIELPGLVNYFRLRSQTTHRNFKASSHILMQQLSLAESLSKSKNSNLIAELSASTEKKITQSKFCFQ